MTRQAAMEGLKAYRKELMHELGTLDDVIHMLKEQSVENDSESTLQLPLRDSQIVVGVPDLTPDRKQVTKRSLRQAKIEEVPEGVVSRKRKDGFTPLEAKIVNYMRAQDGGVAGIADMEKALKMNRSSIQSILRGRADLFEHIQFGSYQLRGCAGIPKPMANPADVDPIAEQKEVEAERRDLLEEEI
jgi:hypothetical protein